MKKLLSLFRRDHRPDIDGLSAYADGRLAPGAAARLESHVAGCAVCAAAVDEVREVRSALRELRQVEAPRSFRLQAGQVREQPMRPRPRAGVYAAPALGFAATVALVVLVGVDLSQGSGGGQAQPSASNFAYSASREGTDSPTRSADAATAKSLESAGAAVAAPAFIATPQAGMPQDNGAAAAPGPATPPTPPAAAADSAQEFSGAGPGTTATAAAEARVAVPTATAEGSQQQPESHNGGGTDWLRVGEIIAACVALGAAGLTVGVFKLRRSET